MKTLSQTAILVFLLLFAFLAAADAQGPKADRSACSGSNGLSSTEIAGLLDAQNAARAELKLAPLSWDCKLADFAQVWASRGVFEHRADNKFGENIFVSTNAETVPSVAVTKWMTEKPFWDNKAAACQDGKICVHYTQIVWKQTTHVGCGINRNASGKYKLLLVCNFNPVGNLPDMAAY
jgi:pathogenesis-related protein 1